MRFCLSLVLGMMAGGLTAQVVWTDPPFPSIDDQVTLYYDATEGNG